MTKESVLEHLSDAKTAHTRWVDRAALVMKGVDVKEHLKPVEVTECSFGKWLHGDGQILSGLSNNPIECMQNIERLHTDFHKHYLNIFHIYFPENKQKGFLSNIFGKKQKEIAEAEVEFAKSEYEKIKEISQELIGEINRLERRLGAVSEEKISSLS